MRLHHKTLDAEIEATEQQAKILKRSGWRKKPAERTNKAKQTNTEQPNTEQTDTEQTNTEQTEE